MKRRSEQSERSPVRATEGSTKRSECTKRVTGKALTAGGVLFILGLVMGALLGIYRLEASSPEGETSGGEMPASVLWHEHWQAAQGYVSSETGYQPIDITPGATSPVVSGKMVKPDGAEAQVELYPDMVVSKWKIHGHIHFR